LRHPDETPILIFMPYFFLYMDPLYWIVIGAGMILSLGASALMKGAYAKYSRIRSSRGYTGAEAARAIMALNGIHDVSIEPVEGTLSDHYDPSRTTLRLPHKNYYEESLASVGIAAHEAGHALQHARSYAPMALRHGLVPVANLGSKLGMIMIFIGMFIGMFIGPFGLMIMKIGIVLFASVLLFQIVTLPVEFNASSRAKRALAETGILDEAELRGASSVLNAAALTYVAAAVSTLLLLLYFMLRAGLLGGRND